MRELVPVSGRRVAVVGAEAQSVRVAKEVKMLLQNMCYVNVRNVLRIFSTIRESHEIHN